MSESDTEAPHSPKVAPGRFIGSHADSGSAGGSSVIVPTIAISVIAALAIAAAPMAEERLGLEAHASKPYADIGTFYEKRYVADHQVALNRVLHVCGTGLVIAGLAVYPSLVLPLASAMSVGYAIFPYTRWMPTGAVEFAAMAVTFLLLGWRGTGSLAPPLLFLVAGYGFAWTGHFFVEQNRPATFIYPSFSLMGDFLMFYRSVTGQWPMVD